jgi:carboxypeptidase C (cathepsin A)
MAMENGPFIFETNKTNFKLNEYSWNKKANVIYLESPGGVGFSKSFTNNTYDDGTVAEDNYRALTDFFRKFPNLKKNDFYISGESYAGIYIPYLARKILDMNRLPNT